MRYLFNGGSQNHVSLEVTREELTVHREKAVLVAVELPSRLWHDQDPLEELRGLAETAGAILVGSLTQRRDNIVPATYIGKGKLEEAGSGSGAAPRPPTSLFSITKLSPAQIRNIEKTLEIKVLDRSELILDIFATLAARTVEAKLQVELAQLEYSLSRA